MKISWESKRLLSKFMSMNICIFNSQNFFKKSQNITQCCIIINKINQLPKKLEKISLKKLNLWGFQHLKQQKSQINKLIGLSRALQWY